MMPLDLLFSTSLAGIEKVINKAVTLDASAAKKLAKISGKTIAVKATSPSVQLYITVLESGVLLSHHGDGKPDASIAAPAKVLLQLLLSADRTSVIRRQGVELQGDTEAIQQVQDLLASLNIDWEYQFSKVLGDVPTQIVSDGIAHLKVFFEQAGTSLRNNIDDYLHEEKKLLPTSQELENFYSAIDQLRLRLDRINARFEKLVTISSK